MTSIASINLSYRDAIVATNVKSIEEAKVIYLLIPHPTSYIEYLTHCLFIETIINSLYKPQDVILVEDDLRKSKKELLKSQIPNLNPDLFNIEGWDDPQACEKAQELTQLRKNLFEAIKGVRKDSSKKALPERLKHYKTLTDFAARYPNTLMGMETIEKHLIGCASDFSEQEFRSQSEHLTIFCELHLTKMEIELTLSTMKQRQDSIKNRTQYHIKPKGKVFGVMGTNHGDPSDIRFKDLAQDLINSLNVPYIVLNPERLKRHP